MRILQVHNRYKEPGGEDQVVDNEAALLERYGHRVLQYLRHNDEVDNLSRPALARRTLWSRTDFDAVCDLIHREKPEVLHVHNTLPLISPSVFHAAARCGVPSVMTLHNYRLVCPAATLFRDGRVCEDCLKRALPWPAVVHACYRSSRSASSVVTAMLGAHRLLGTWSRKVGRYIALTPFAREKMIEGGLEADRVVVKPNFVMPDPGPGSRGGGYALFVGRLTVEKGLRTLIGAWEKLDREVKLVIVGDGPLRGEVERAAGRDPRIAYKGRLSRSDTLRYMADAGCMIFPSAWYEGFPMVIAEAFAAGIPVMCADIGSAPSIVENERTGFHFEVNDSSDLAAKVDRFEADPAVAADLARRARAQYESCYAPETNYKILMSVYEQVLSPAAEIR